MLRRRLRETEDAGKRLSLPIMLAQVIRHRYRVLKAWPLYATVHVRLSFLAGQVL